MREGVFPARQGFVWFTRGFALWRSAFIPLTASAMTMFMSVMLGMLIPLINLFAAYLVYPTLGIGLFLCCQAIARGQRVMPGLLFRNFGRHLRSLIGLFVVRCVGELACLYLASLITGTSLGGLSIPAQVTEQTTAAFMEQLMPMLAVFFVLRLPLEMAMWFAAPLRALRGMSVGKSLFFSFVVCWRNLLPLFCFLFAYFSLACVLPSLILSILALIVPALASLLTVPVLMALTPIFYAGFYQSARDIFGEWPEEA